METVKINAGTDAVYGIKYDHLANIRRVLERVDKHVGIIHDNQFILIRESDLHVLVHWGVPYQRIKD